MMVQECFTCAKIGACAQTNSELTLKSYVCPLFAQVDEAVIFARNAMFHVYGPTAAVRALLNRPRDPNEEYYEMSLETPPQGTSYSDRKKQLEIMSFMEVRILGTKKYKDEHQTPILDWNETLALDKREQSIEKILDFELTNNIIVPDANQPVQGAQQMAQPPYQPPPVAPQMPIAQPPQAPQMPQMPPRQQPPSIPPPGPVPPYGMTPMPQMGVPPGAPQQFSPQVPPMAPPMPMMAPPAPAVQAAQAAQAQPAPATTGKKRGRGAAAAPPPPPPPSPAAAPPQQFAQPPPVPQGYQPPAQIPFAQQMMQPPPPMVPSMSASNGIAAMDLSPVLQLIDKVGQGVNALGNAEQETLKQLTALLNDIRVLMLVQVAAMHHIYMGQPHIQQLLAGKDVGDVPKFIAYMQPFLPR